MKKIKNSVKTEMKSMVQKELARIMAKQISNEDFFKEMVQDVINDFYEEENLEQKSKEEAYENPMKNRLGHLSDIMSGKFKNRFSALVNKGNEGKTENLSNFLSSSPPVQFRTPIMSTASLSQDQLNSIFREPNAENLSALKNINAEQSTNDYEKIQRPIIKLDELIKYVEAKKSSLRAVHEQTHSDKKTIETYKITNNKDGDTPNHLTLNHFSFDLEITTNKNTEKRTTLLKNVIVPNFIYEQKDIDFESAEKLLTLAKEIYSETIIKPLSQTEQVKEKTQLAKRTKTKKTKVSANKK